MGDTQESGFHSGPGKRFAFMVLTFQSISPVFVAFCSILPCSSTYSPFCWTAPCSYSHLFSSTPCIVSVCFLRQCLSPLLGSLFKIPVPPFPHVQGVSSLGKVQFSFHCCESFILLSPYFTVSQSHPPFPAVQYQLVLHFLSPLLLIPLSVLKYLYLKVFCLTALFTFHLWNSSLGF